MNTGLVLIVFGLNVAVRVESPAGWVRMNSHPC
jgi:hypothetical protein